MQLPRLLRAFSLAALPLVALACGGSNDEVTAPVVDSGRPDATTTPDTAVDDVGTDTFVPTPDAAETSVPDAETGPDWPSCDSKPAGTTTATIPEIWTANPTAPKYSWVSGVVITAVSGGGCVADAACQIFVQQESPETTLAGVSKKALKVFISAKTASRFTGLVPGDKVDLAAHAWRYNIDGQNELLLQINDLTRGCMKKTGTGTINPVPATLADLGSVTAYESDIGPVLLKLTTVSGTTKASLAQIFGMFPTGGFDAGSSQIVSLSPYCLAGNVFGSAMTTAKRYDFDAVTGVFGLFIDPTPKKYSVVYPRTMADLAIR